MVWTRNAWNNFKAQPEIWFFHGFLLTSVLSIRKVFFDYPIRGDFNEYAGVYLYLSDLLFLGMMAAWLLSILYNKYHNLSIKDICVFHPARESKLFHPGTNVPRGTFYWASVEQFRFLQSGTFLLLAIPLALVAWSFLSIKWSNNASIALYRSFKLFEFYLLYLFLVLNSRCSTVVKPPNFLRTTFRLIIALSLINALIAIFQFILQHSLGLFWLKESLISRNLPGVAKVVFAGESYIRAYGLFPHPNILGGFLFLGIILTLVHNRLFHPSTNVPRGTFYGASVEQAVPHCATQCAEWKNGACKIYSTPKSFFVTRTCSTPAWPVGRWNIRENASHYIFSFILGLQIVAGILTFSKSAILGLILALTYMFHPRRNVPPQKECSTPEGMFHGEHSTGQAWNILRGKRGTSYGAGVEHFSILRDNALKKIILATVTLGLLVYLVRPDYYSIFVKSMEERLAYVYISLNMILANLLAGIGSGQFVLEMQKYSPKALLAWQFQPVHNAFLLIWSELGLIGLSIFVWFIWKLFHPSRNVPRGTSYEAGVKQEQVASDSKNVPPQYKCSTGNILRGKRGTAWDSQELQTVFKALLIGFFVIALFDHYLWDIQQGQIMLWLALGFLANARYSTILT